MSLDTRGADAAHRYLTQYVNSMVLEIQLPHQIVNVVFLFVIVDNKFTVVWGGWLSKTI